MRKITIVKLFCNHCKKEFWPKIDDITDEVIKPKVCRYQECKSPTWDKKRKKN